MPDIVILGLWHALGHAGHCHNRSLARLRSCQTFQGTVSLRSGESTLTPPPPTPPNLVASPWSHGCCSGQLAVVRSAGRCVGSAVACSHVMRQLALAPVVVSHSLSFRQLSGQLSLCRRYRSILILVHQIASLHHAAGRDSRWQAELQCGVVPCFL